MSFLFIQKMPSVTAIFGPTEYAEQVRKFSRVKTPYITRCRPRAASEDRRDMIQSAMKLGY